MANNGRRLHELEAKHAHTPVRFYIEDTGEYECMTTQRKSDTLEDLRSDTEESFVFQIKHPADDE